MASSAEYWKGRMKALEETQYRRTTGYYQDLQKQFRMAQNSLQMDIGHWYQRLADNNDISLAAARRLLDKNELDEFHWTVDEYIRQGERSHVDGRWMKQLENASARVHINRLEAMKLQIQQHAELLYQNYNHGVTEFLEDSYADNFCHTAYEAARGTGAGTRLAMPDTKRIDVVVNTPWAQDNMSFSERIWQNRNRLVQELHTELTQSIILGESPDRAARRLAESMGAKARQARTLVYTESAAIAMLAQKDCFKELGVEQFEVVETLDSNTCETCGGMDGQHFPMSEFQIGVTAPPFHPNCRGCTCPYFGDEFDNVGERAARGGDGKTYYVPADTTYEEWKKAFVDGDMEARDRLGLITNNNKNNPRYYDFKGKDLKTVEQELSQNDYETAVIFANGKAISCQLGNEDTIKFTKHQLKLMKGNDVTHNHPLNTPPSPEDLYLLVDYKARSFRTCGKNGAYVLEYNENIQKLPISDKFSDDYNRLLYQLKPKIIEQYYNGHNEQEVLVKLGEEIWNELYKLYGVKPRFERR